jgi:hypothetical protein
MANSEQSGITWRKSTASGGGGGNCVQVAFIDDSVLVRDSKDPSGPVLSFSHSGWAAFLIGTRGDQLPDGPSGTQRARGARSGS